MILEFSNIVNLNVRTYKLNVVFFLKEHHLFKGHQYFVTKYTAKKGN